MVGLADIDVLPSYILPFLLTKYKITIELIY